MARAGWSRLIPGDHCFHGPDAFSIDAYSEFMPAPRVGCKPYGTLPVDPYLFSPDDPFGWKIHEFDEVLELQPGLHHIARQLLTRLKRLQDGNPEHGLPRHISSDNPFWPPELACEKCVQTDRCVLLLPLALSRTQDDKGRVRWTLFGNSEQGPGKAFWKSFFTAPGVEAPPEMGIGLFCRLLQAVYGENVTDADGLRQAGFRILPDDQPDFAAWSEGDLPSWATAFLLRDDEAANGVNARGVKYLVTFRAFGRLPEAVRKGYADGRLALLPFPGSLVFWGVERARRVFSASPLALQIPLLFNVNRHESPIGIRVPQAGVFHEPNAERPDYDNATGHLRNTYKRTHRWEKILRDQDEALVGKESPLIHVLFSTGGDDLELYGKPMARNVQIWTEHAEPVLNGPHASAADIKRAMQTIRKGGVFGYRFVFPAMRVGEHEVYWHRPLVAYRNSAGETVVLPDAPLGYLTAYDADKPRLDRAIELWPRLQQRPVLLAALAGEDYTHKRQVPPQVRNIRKLTHAYALFGAKPLPLNFALRIMGLNEVGAGVRMLAHVPEQVADGIRGIVENAPTELPVARRGRAPQSLTYAQTARRSFEIQYWKTIASLAETPLLNKNNADWVQDEATQRMLPYRERHLEPLGDQLLAYYEKKIAAAKMTGKALAGDVPFRWRTDMDYTWMGGWQKNRDADAERNLLIVIPGKNRREAVIMADHYDTAYMLDKYDKAFGGCGARMAACGADDNHSATAAMMMAAPIFLAMSRQGKLGCDIWLVHLTGEEFPADCLGARALTERLVQRTLQLRLPRGKTRDLSATTVRGVYVSDMIAHNNDRERDVFQISPGNDPGSMWLAYQAHVANEIWNESVPYWNKSEQREGLPRGRRSPNGAAIPEVAPFLPLSGHVRVPSDPRSTLYNTDGQIFSDAGVPVVLFMENYDINRTGYHDTHDTMENIDLDYGAAVCAITIEAVARAASAKESPVGS
jgi:hypothetical protein